jgi:hypothetical protein
VNEFGSVLAKISRLVAILKGAGGRVDAGMPIDLAHMERDADAVCRSLADLPKAEAQGLAPNLEELLSLLDDMEQRLEARRAEYDKRLSNLDGNFTGGC